MSEFMDQQEISVKEVKDSPLHLMNPTGSTAALASRSESSQHHSLDVDVMDVAMD